MPIQKMDYIWFNGELVEWDKATVHVLSHAIHYGTSFFEGIRCYETPQGPAIFRLTPHMQRLIDSAKIYRTTIPYTLDQLVAAVKETVRANRLRSGYIRPVVFRGYGEIGVNPLNNPVEVAIATIEWGKYLGAEAMEQGVDVCISSWNRFAPNTMPALAKAGGNYMNSQLIKMEAIANGYAEGIALDADGHISEGSGENLFLVRNGVVYTPPLTSSILSGITRDTVMTLLREMGVEVREQVLPREMLYLADELFFTGTAAEITPIRSVDRIPVGTGRRGPITAAVQEVFFGIVQGERPDRYGWLEYA
ncbi:MAG: branched chain amino acid aminotransferase [Chloroflexus sp.]|jgi:branched-chain amino acid aminotransferase|uniref:Branched-chain-amino-acid aminotransferase n=1 Tax=Chloroflexus aurantiacus (strain ATCC 29366 / DSM 635 / J-10-fl) TaxID=324602 RepID=A9WE76_CHLAA|nr:MULTISPECIES: branched-chain amino acid transaminase [Chloroflexus]RMG49709.1 MAG: branched-chain amino acid transaminase [Chloroflexota bacterium]ABY33736.1 branched-chain amino acid aminotransferase [Chloroflexus aurantiacus J-10-fl]GIV86709.1 MAG: branched chain amino acid aminotransferase [Chloroflexus sp.]GIV94365.1 MAG: branched chain amino acid aminotransferase [Chloroflexus sp.]HBW68184.1 branched-chain amino acid transaminase [Chloroflexus aurantiacus]